MNDSYGTYLNRRIDEIRPGVSSSLETIDVLEPAIALKVLRELVANGCKATNDAAIRSAHIALAKIPAAFLQANLADAALASLDLNDEWEYRRLLELLREVRPSLMSQFITSGAASTDPGVREAAHDFAAAGHGKI